MPKINARAKGQRGERAVIDWLQPIVSEICLRYKYSEITLQRNTLQSDGGGSDISGIPGMAIEVKNTASNNDGNLSAYWQQAVEQAMRFGNAREPLLPVLLYKRPHLPFRARLEGHIGWSSKWIKGHKIECSYNKPIESSASSQEINYGLKNVICDIDKDAFERFFRIHLLSFINNEKGTSY